jgi:hypothetical protein
METLASPASSIRSSRMVHDALTRSWAARADQRFDGIQVVGEPAGRLIPPCFSLPALWRDRLDIAKTLVDDAEPDRFSSRMKRTAFDPSDVVWQAFDSSS